MLLRHDMLGMGCEMTVLLTEQAVFASVIRPAADQVPRGGIHHAPGFDSKLRKALSLRIAMQSDALTNASYSARSSSVRALSFARSAGAPPLSWTFAPMRNSPTRRADTLSRHRVNGSRR